MHSFTYGHDFSEYIRNGLLSYFFFIKVLFSREFKVVVTKNIYRKLARRP